MSRKLSLETRAGICEVWDKNPELSLQDAARRFGLSSGETIRKIVKHLAPHKHYGAALRAGTKTRSEG